MTTIKIDGTQISVALDKPPDLQTLKAGIGGGWLEAVPGWQTLTSRNPVPCVAFCDEEGKLKGMPVNEIATLLWHAALDRDGIKLMHDVLVGDVVLLTGDAAFMRSLRADADEDDGE